MWQILVFTEFILQILKIPAVNLYQSWGKYKSKPQWVTSHSNPISNSKWKWECGELEHHALLVLHAWYTFYGTIRQLLKKLTMELPCDPVIIFLNSETWHANVYYSIIHNSQRGNHVSHRWVNKMYVCIPDKYCVLPLKYLGKLAKKLPRIRKNGELVYKHFCLGWWKIFGNTVMVAWHNSNGLYT